MRRPAWIYLLWALCALANPACRGSLSQGMRGPALERCRSFSDIKRMSGRRGVVVGVYHEIDVRKRVQGDELHRGHAALRLADGTVVLLEPSWSRAALRPRAERRQFAGREVEVSGTVHALSPSSPDHPAQLMNPCVSPVEQIRGSPLLLP